MMYRDFAELLQKFFEDYLVKERGVSKNTMRSYRDCFVQFLEYLTSYRRIKPQDVSMDIMNRDLIVNFLNWLEDNNNCSIQTRNQRLSCMRSFFSYMMYLDPSHLQTVLDAAVYDGTLYAICDDVKGASLRSAFLMHGQYGEKEVLRWARGTAKALSTLHGRRYPIAHGRVDMAHAGCIQIGGGIMADK